MTSPGAAPKHEKAHEHIDLGELMDASGRGPGPEAQRGEPADYPAGADLSGEVSDGYVSGQDEGSID